MIQKTMAFVIGALLLQYQPELPHFGWNLLLIPVTLLAWYFRTSSFVHFPVFLITGFFWASLQAHQSLAPQLIPELEKQDLLATGVISSLPDITTERTRFEFVIERLEHAGESIDFPQRILLNWYRNAPPIAVGERWQLVIRLKRPHSMLNPGGGDYERILYINGIKATGYVRAETDNRRLNPAGSGQLFNRLREQIRFRINQAIEDKGVQGIVRALVIGDRSLIVPNQWEVFRQTGTNHLMAISGLHIGIVSGLFFFLASALWKRFPHGCLWLPAQQIGAVAAILSAFCYAGLAGFAIPCVRALIMLSVVMGSLLYKRSISPHQPLCFALFLVVLLDPVSVISSGFWLSFAAVIIIMVAMQGRLGRRNVFLWNLVRIQWVVSLGLAPVLLLLGFDVPLLSPLVNFVMVPLFSLLLVPLLLLTVALLCIWTVPGLLLLMPSVWLIEKIQWVLAWIADYDFTVSLLGTPPTWMLMGLLLSILLHLLPSGIPGRWLGLLLLFPLILFKNPPLEDGQVHLTLLDVGQGLSIVVRTTNHVLLYDVGPSYPSGFDTGKLVVLPFLKSQNIQYIDKVIVSNGDSDHRGGLNAVLEKRMIGELLSGEPQRIPGVTPKQCLAGLKWEWDGVGFEILHPDSSRDWTGNNASCVLAVRSGTGQLLLTGDIEAAAEASLVARYKTRLSSAIVTVPHHGSASSSGNRFIQMTRAQYGLISAGYKNRYKFPREEVRSRWENAKTTLLNTAESGAISLILTPDGTIHGPWAYRAANRRYWMSGLM